METLLILLFLVILAIRASFRSPSVKGSIGESRVSRRLNLFLPGNSYVLFNDVTLPTPKSSAQIDHIIVSPFGVFVIETKNYSGWIFGSANSKEWTQVLYKKKYRLFNPLRQNAWHVKAVKRFLSLPDRYVFSVVVFVGSAKIKTKKELPSNVVYLRKLRSYIRSYREQLLSAHEVDSILKKFADHQADLMPSEPSVHSPLEITLPICPECGGMMIKRTATQGKYKGKRFWGCSGYPSCMGIRNI